MLGPDPLLPLTREVRDQRRRRCVKLCWAFRKIAMREGLPFLRIQAKYVGDLLYIRYSAGYPEEVSVRILRECGYSVHELPGETKWDDLEKVPK